jgi:hypothetical protein
VGDCLKEAAEFDYWLALIADESVMAAVCIASVRQETGELIAIFTASLNTAKARL